MVLQYGLHRKELAGGFRRTTQNRMDIYAMIVGLEALKEPCTVTVYSAANHVVDAMNAEAIAYLAAEPRKCPKCRPVAATDRFMPITRRPFRKG